jgi:hypothetical protein
MGFSDWGLIVTAGLVVIGVLLEGAEHLQELRTKGWRPITPKIGFLILVLGLGGEIVFETLLTQDAANTRLEAAKLESILAWRTLTEKQRTELISTMRPFKGQRIDIFSYVGDAEGLAFADQFLAIFKRAGCDAGESVITSYSRLLIGTRVEIGSSTQELSGVFVIRIALTPEGRKAAETLLATLKGEHLTQEPKLVPMMPKQWEAIEQQGLVPISEAPIRLMIGVKPR